MGAKIDELIITTEGTEVLSVARTEHEGQSLKGFNYNVATDGVVETIASSTGKVLVSDKTNGDSAIISVHEEAGVLVVTKESGSDEITTTKDTAAKINVYVESGKVIVQSKLAATADINVKVYE